MRLNTLSPAEGSKKPAKRVGRGIGSTLGKTCGRGHKGLKSRSGGKVAPGFEGGQMPLKQRLPKFGFNSRKALTREELRLSDLNRVEGDVIDFAVLKEQGIIKANTKTVKIMKSGELTKAVTVKGLPISAGAKQAVVDAGGKVED